MNSEKDRIGGGTVSVGTGELGSMLPLTFSSWTGVIKGMDGEDGEKEQFSSGLTASDDVLAAVPSLCVSSSGVAADNHLAVLAIWDK